MNIRYFISVWRTIRIPGLLPIMRDWGPFLRTHFLYAALESGLLHALQTGAAREDLLVKLGVQRPELLDALLDLGLALKELTLRNGTFRIKGKRSRTLAAPRGDALAAMVQANATYYNAAYRNLSARMRGAPLGDDLCDIGDLVARFSKIGEPILDGFIKSQIPGTGPVRVLDVGCGSGFVLKTARQTNELANGVGIDADENVTRQARSNLKAWGIEDDFKIVTGDIRSQAKSLQGEFDLVTAFNLIYYLSEDQRPEFFDMLGSLLKPEGCLAVANTFQSIGRDAAAANLNIVNCSLKHLSALPDLAATKRQLAQSGLRRIKTSRFMPGSEFYGITATV